MIKGFYYINVYKFPSGKVWLGDSSFTRTASILISLNAIKNGCKLLYRLKVKLK